jgi:DNA-binding transcriptional LysR family regulator
MRPLDTRQLSAFAAVARHGGFSAAAREVKLTQPTLSTHIANLERELGVKLFDRSARKVSLTPAGELFAGYADRILALCSESMEAVQGFTGQISGEVSIAASTVPGEYLLPGRLAGFAARYPEVTVTLLVADSEAVTKSVLQGETAIGVTGRPAGDPSLRSRLMCDDRIILVAPPGISGTHGRQLDAADLARIPIIRRERGSATRKVVDGALKKAGKDPESYRWIATVGSTRAMIEAAASGLGAAFVSREAAARELADGKLSEIPVKNLDLDRGFYIITSVERTLSPAAGKIIELLLEGQERSKGS